MERIYTAQGPQRAEKLLIENVVAEARAAVGDPTLLQRPVLVVVPSSELRLGVVTRLAAAGATLGVEVQTLHSVALNLHRAAGHTIDGGALLSEILGRRAVKQQPGLRQTFEPLVDGLGLVAASVRDLLSADFRPIDDARHSAQTQELLRATAETQQQMQHRSCRRPGDWQQSAAPLVEPHLHARSVWIYGFADVSGQACRLVQALWNHGAKLVVDLPQDPAFGGEDRGARFARNFVQRVCGETLADIPDSQSNVTREFFHTSGRSDEVREVAHRIRRLIADGTQPEKIGVVVRQYDAYAGLIRQWFPALAVPFRAPTPPPGFFPDHRRMRAALEVLELGPTAKVDRWLDALSRSEQGLGLKSRVEDFRIAMRTLGVARLEQAAALDAQELTGDSGVFRLPVRTRSESDQPLEEGQPRRSQTRALTFTQLMGDIDLVQQTLQRIADWPRRTTLAEHADYARLVLEQVFGWSSSVGNWTDTSTSTGVGDWHDLLRTIGSLAEDDDFSADEFKVLLVKASKDFGVPKPTFTGGGVAVLDVTQARGCTFDALFVLGLNRHVMPRAISDDAVLPDSQRALLQASIPDLPLIQSSHDEERYLFAQLCSAAPKLTLSWLRADDDGKEIAPSSFLQRIWLANRAGEKESDAQAIPRLRNELFADASQPLCESEASQFLALNGDRAGWSQLQPVAANARLRVLNEIEPDFGDRQQRHLKNKIGPYLGVTGAATVPDPMFVTTLESVAACPWRALLERRLRIEPIDDPIHDLPGTDALMIGNVVHDALDRLVQQGADGKLDGKVAVPVGRPNASQVSAALKASATKVALAEEMRLQGMIDALAFQAEPFLQRAVDLEWPDDDAQIDVIGCEWQGKTMVAGDGEDFELHFRADRVDQGEDGLVFTDYKTSKPLREVVREDKKREHHLSQLSEGKRLQVTAYASSSFDARGRYLFLNVGESKMHRMAEFRVDHEDGDFMQAFSQTSGILHRALAHGMNLPRMNRPGKDGGISNSACGYCKVADACLLRDSGNRRRLSAAMESIAEQRTLHEDQISDAERLISDLWYLGVQAPWAEEVEQ